MENWTEGWVGRWMNDRIQTDGERWTDINIYTQKDWYI